MRRRILLISYVFPPVGGIMVQRVLSFARYLPQHDLDVHVLSAWNPATPVYDPSLLKQVPAEVKQFHAVTPEPPFYLRKNVWSKLTGGDKNSGRAGDGPKESNSAQTGGWKSRIIDRIHGVLCPDAQVLWVPFALSRATSIIRRHKIDTVLVTAPPFSLFLVGNELKRRFPHIRLVSDFRDEWLRFMLTDFAHYAGDRIRRRAEEIERQTVESSDLVLAVTRSSLAEIRSRYPRQPDEKFAFLPNGYDPATFEQFRSRPREDRRVVITHNGTAYRTSSPQYYLDALDAMPREIRDQIETRFIGRVAETEDGQFSGRASSVTVHGFLPQSEALRRLEETDYLLLTMTNDFSLPGKLFEYLATGKPVLALSPPGGEVDQLLKETRGGWCVPHTDRAAIQQLLRQAYEDAAAGRTWTVDQEAVRRYERPRLAAELAARLKALP